MDAEFWDERYREQEQLWSGRPNGVLVTEVAELAPGQALDVGCGEGADALWLAEKGWRVTAVDVSQVALERAAAQAAGNPAVSWVRADLTASTAPSGGFDLVSVQYFPLPHQAGDAALRRLLAAVAPGGTVLVVGHDLSEMDAEHDHDFDPADYYQPHEIADLLGDEWSVLVNETRPRTAPAPPGTGHVQDTVLRAQRQG